VYHGPLLRVICDASTDFSRFFPKQIKADGRKAIGVWRRFLPFPLQSGGRIGAGEDAEQRLRWLLYILLLSLSSLDLDNVSRVEVTLRPWNNLLHLLLRLAGTCSTASEEMKKCVPTGSGDLIASDLVWFYSAPYLISVGAAVSDGFGRYVRQLNKKLGWILFSTCFGGFILLRVLLSSAVLEILVPMGVPDSLYSGDVVACGHLIWLGRSSVTKCVDISICCTKCQQKFMVHSRERGRLQVPDSMYFFFNLWFDMDVSCGYSDHRRRGRLGG